MADILQKDLVAQDYFLYGYTSDGYQIALYTGYDRRKISTNYKLKPALYIVSKSNIKQYDMSTFQAVEFVGGTLNNLYEQKSINTRYDNSQQCFIKVYPEKRKEFAIKIGNYDCKLIIRNVPSEISPSKMDLIIRYEFQDEVPLIEIKLVYNVLVNICRFMTNRKNVGFDNVKLFQIDKETKNWLCFADVCIDFRCSSLTSKEFRNNILFDYLKDCIINLHTIVSSNEERKATYMFDFYANSDMDYTVLSDDKIKNICSSIECELGFIKDLKGNENTNLTDLIMEVKKVIKTHRESQKKLEDKTYDMIFSSMSHWEMPNSRRIYLLYERNKIYMDILKNRTGLYCTEEMITEFVKFRNDITHGKYRTIDSSIAITSYTLMALSYCCFLQRIGMRENELKRLFDENRIGS